MIETITISIAILGCVFLLMLWVRVRQADQDLKLKKHRSTKEGFVDKLIYANVVADGVIVNKNGSFTMAWLYKGSDNASATNTERNANAIYINQALARLGSGWVSHTDAVRREAPQYSDSALSEFPDPISHAVDEERRRLFEQLGTMYEGYFVLSMTYMPPTVAQAKFVEMMFEDGDSKQNDQQRSDAMIEAFERDIQNIESRLSGAFDLVRLKGNVIHNEDGSTVTHDDLLRWIQYCATGLNHPITLPQTPVYIDALIGGQEFDGGVVPRIGRNYIQVVAIEGYPLESSPGILTALAELPVAYRWSSRFIFMDAHEAIAHYTKLKKKWGQKTHGFFDSVFNNKRGDVNLDALAMVNDSSQAIAEIESGLVAAGYYTSVVILMDPDRAKLLDAAIKVEKQINSLGFAARVEDVNTMDAFFGSLPGHAVENVRRPMMNTLNYAHFLPTSSIWTGEESAPCPLYPPKSPALLHGVTTGHSPFRLNMHVGDLGHFSVFGPTRAGKSTLLALIAMQFRRYRGMRIYAFDKGMSMYPTCMAVGGTHYDVAGDNDTLAFCPLQFLDTKEDRAWAMEWIDTILALNDLKTNPAQRNAIGVAIINMNQTGSRTLSDFCSTVQDVAVREALKQYTVDGAMGHLLDASEDSLALSDFTTFEISTLMNLSDKYGLPVLLYIFRRIERSLDGRPTAMLLDEAWMMLGHAVWRAKLREFLKTLAKLNCIVGISTQNLSDAKSSGILDVIVESTASKIFLPNVFATNDESVDLYTAMGLNKRQIDIISKATRKRDYYYVSEQGCRLFQLALGPLALAFVAATDKESINEIKGLVKRFGKAWVPKWLETKELNLQDYLGDKA